MSEIRYLLDENVDPQYRTGLLRREPSLIVYRVGITPTAPIEQTPDPDILDWCEKHSFILVTNNRKTMPVPCANIWKQIGMCRAFSS